MIGSDLTQSTVNVLTPVVKYKREEHSEKGEAGDRSSGRKEGQKEESVRD